ncbi:MAG: alcohol dehydrogenase catalytic domain-containing protein [Deltaproteobacteria bacterium]|jgi:alcohol dehydrogenase|nr:alcohol dehydrogenase catalytic domain-containing protein [Deltaproteobacteria bacterium]
MKKKMKGVVFHGIGDISIEELDVPIIQKASDAIIRITLTTICGSDLHLIHGQTVVDPESPIGHECVGVVEAVGEDVTSFKPGDRVIVPTFTHCGNCFFCKKGSPSQCEKGGIIGFGSIRGGLGGAQTEYVRVPFADMSLVKTPDNLSDEDVLFVGDVIATAYFALENVPIKPGDTVAIVGPGPVGLAVQEIAPVFGAGKIIMIGTREYRMEVAGQRGATLINPNQENAPEKVLELTNGYGADVVVECAGTPESFQIAFDSVRKGGSVSLMGMWGEPVEVPLNDMVMNNITIFTGLVDCNRLEEIVQLIEAGRINTNFLITHRMKLDDILEAYRIFENKEDNVLKIAITP